MLRKGLSKAMVVERRYCICQRTQTEPISGLTVGSVERLCRQNGMQPKTNSHEKQETFFRKPSCVTQGFFHTVESAKVRPGLATFRNLGQIIPVQKQLNMNSSSSPDCQPKDLPFSRPFDQHTISDSPDSNPTYTQQTTQYIANTSSRPSPIVIAVAFGNKRRSPTSLDGFHD
jgi:hypothetical protein